MLNSNHASSVSLTIKPFLRLFYWFWGPVCTIAGIRACSPKNVPMPQPQCSVSASGLWSTDVSPIPAVTHSSQKMTSGPLSHLDLFSAKVPFSWTQPTSFIPRSTAFFNYVIDLLVCIVPPSQAFPVLINSCQQILLASVDIYQLWSCRGRLKESSGAKL